MFVNKDYYKREGFSKYEPDDLFNSSIVEDYKAIYNRLKM